MKAIIPSLPYLAITLLLGACAANPVPNQSPASAASSQSASQSTSQSASPAGSPSFNEAAFCGNRGGFGGIDCDKYREGKAQLLDEHEQPQANASLTLNGIPLQSDAQGKFPIPDLKGISASSPRLEREGYWSYDQRWPLNPRFKLAKKLPGEQDRYQKPFDQVTLLQLNVKSVAEGKSLKDLMSTETKTDYSYLEIRTAGDFEGLLNGIGEGNYSLFPPNPSPEQITNFKAADAKARIEAALASGKRLIAFTNNVFFRYQNMVDHWYDTPEGHILSVNRSEVLTYGGGSGHSYDYEVLIFALPDSSKPVTFAVGKDSLTVKR